MKNFVSILIPTYKRPDLLLHCVQCALAQTYTDIEVVVSDDSDDDASEVMLKKEGLWDKVRYVRHDPPLVQAENVNVLFSMARAERIVLIHDDDWLLPNAVEELDKVWKANEDMAICYGLQYVASAEGVIDYKQSERLNEEYHRVPEYFGVQKEPHFSALMGQIPNNGYMVRTDLAQKVGYSLSPSVSHACDFDFGLRLAQQGGTWALSPAYVSVVRLSEDSILRSKGKKNYLNFSDITWNLVKNYRMPAHLENWRTARLQATATGAIEKWLIQGYRGKALRVMFSGKYEFWKSLSKRKIAFLAMLFLPAALNKYIATQILNR